MRIIENTYGSNEDGLVWGYRFMPGQAAEPIGTDAVAAFLAGDGPPEAFLWLHFALSNQGSERFLRRNLALPDAFYDSLGSEVGEDVELRIEALDLADVRFGQVHHADLACAEQPQLLHRRQQYDFRIVHGRAAPGFVAVSSLGVEGRS